MKVDAKALSEHTFSPRKHNNTARSRPLERQCYNIDRLEEPSVLRNNPPKKHQETTLKKMNPKKHQNISKHMLVKQTLIYHHRKPRKPRRHQKTHLSLPSRRRSLTATIHIMETSRIAGARSGLLGPKRRILYLPKRRWSFLFKWTPRDARNLRDAEPYFWRSQLTSLEKNIPRGSKGGLFGGFYMNT